MLYSAPSRIAGWRGRRPEGAKPTMAQESERMRTRFPRAGHTIEVVVEAEALERQRKHGRVVLTRPPGSTFVISCDEGAYLDGDDTAPPPLAYLSASVAF